MVEIKVLEDKNSRRLIGRTFSMLHEIASKIVHKRAVMREVMDVGKTSIALNEVKTNNPLIFFGISHKQNKDFR